LEGSPQCWIKYIAIFDKDRSGNIAGGYAWTILFGQKSIEEMTRATVALLPKLNRQRDARGEGQRILPVDIENIVHEMIK